MEIVLAVVCFSAVVWIGSIRRRSWLPLWVAAILMYGLCVVTGPSIGLLLTPVVLFLLAGAAILRWDLGTRPSLLLLAVTALAAVAIFPGRLWAGSGYLGYILPVVGVVAIAAVPRLIRPASRPASG